MIHAECHVFACAAMILFGFQGRIFKMDFKSDLTTVIGHAANALTVYADTAREQRARGVARGLSGFRGVRALCGAANRADELAGDLTGLVAGDYEFTAGDWTWLELAFDKVWRSRRTVISAAERDISSFDDDDRDSPEFDQLAEMENRGGMYNAHSAVASIADAIRFTLSGRYDPTRARVIVAEEMASLHNTMRELGL
jgi:hypothetical protein